MGVKRVGAPGPPAQRWAVRGRAIDDAKQPGPGHHNQRFGIVRGLKEAPSEEERYAVADHVVRQLRERGDPWRLDEEIKAAAPPST